MHSIYYFLHIIVYCFIIVYIVAVNECIDWKQWAHWAQWKQ
jgi:hypothetical protein